jgi:hypothetical protein
MDIEHTFHLLVKIIHPFYPNQYFIELENIGARFVR